MGSSIVAAIVLAFGCAHPSAQRRSLHAPVVWEDGPLVGGALPDTPLPRATLVERVARLDRLIDLLDAARFGEDDGAREQLWAELGGFHVVRGDQATRRAMTSLLEEALAIERALPPAAAAGDRPEAAGDENLRSFVADAVMLLSTDVVRPGSAEDLATATLSYRTLAETGHPRLQDNARWRLYDHVRGCLDGAATATATRRLDVFLHGFYDRHESIAAWLREQDAPHVRPALPAPAELVAGLRDPLRALAADPRWKPIVDRLAQRDLDLTNQALGWYPAARDPEGWPLPDWPQGTGRRETFAPVVLASVGRAVVDEGRPLAKTLATTGGTFELTAALEATLARDGRGSALLIAPSDLPSPEVHVLLLSLARARAGRIEFGGREPRIPEGTGHVVLSLPIQVARRDDTGIAAASIRSARVQAHLSGREVAFIVDGACLTPVAPTQTALSGAARMIRTAYPRESIVALELHDDLLYGQLTNALAALSGGPDRAFETVGWIVDAELSATPTKGSETGPKGSTANAAANASAKDRCRPGDADATVRLRQSLGQTPFTPSVTLPHPLVTEDAERLNGLLERFTTCLPDLERPIDASGVGVRLDFELGVVASAALVESTSAGRPRRKSVRKPHPVAHDPASTFVNCLREVAGPFRLRQHRDKISAEIRFTPRAAAAPR